VSLARDFHFLVIQDWRPKKSCMSGRNWFVSRKFKAKRALLEMVCQNGVFTSGWAVPLSR
jgi:hypothetical protein